VEEVVAVHRAIVMVLQEEVVGQVVLTVQVELAEQGYSRRVHLVALEMLEQMLHGYLLPFQDQVQVVQVKEDKVL
jgi:hypothetical protein